MLHRLAELDPLIRAAYAEFDFKRIFAALNAFMTVDLSAFYFDIRKDALYCDPYSSVTRKACLTVLDQLFRCHGELARADALLHRRGGLARARSGGAFGSPRTFPAGAGGLARRRAGREMAQIAQPAPRGHRRARDRAGGQAHRLLPRSGARSSMSRMPSCSPPRSMSTLPNCASPRPPPWSKARGRPRHFGSTTCAGVAVEPRRAEGRKCARSWKISPRSARSAISRRDAARCPGAARMGSHAQGGGVGGQRGRCGARQALTAPTPGGH